MHVLCDEYAEAMERSPMDQPPSTLPRAVTIPFLPSRLAILFTGIFAVITYTSDKHLGFLT